MIGARTPPQSVRIAAWLFAATTLLYNILLPGGRLALNALHPESRGESPLLSIMAMGAGLVIVAPRLLLSALAYFNILQGAELGKSSAFAIDGLKRLFLDSKPAPRAADIRSADVAAVDSWKRSRAFPLRRVYRASVLWSRQRVVS